MTKRALITGASEGIGRTFAEKLAGKGYSITAVARNELRLKELTNSLPKADIQHTYFSADLSTENGVEKVTSLVASEHYDIFINNAGFGVYGSFDQAPLEKLQEMTKVNCDALVALSYAYLKTTKPGDALINVASVASFLPLPQNALYAATKAFVASLSQSLWYEQKERNVYVMALCPGYTATEFHKRAGGKSRKPPSMYGQTTNQVVDSALNALNDRCTPIVVPGVTNKAMVETSRFLPRKILVKLIGNATKAYYG